MQLKLENFQKRTLAWMTQRENEPTQLESHPLWRPIRLSDDTQLFYNVCMGKLLRTSAQPPHDIRGGILAEEMGGLILLRT